MNIGYILSGGFAKGYRTYIMAGVIVVTALAHYAVGDVDLMGTVEAVATGLGIGSLRAAFPAK